MNKILFSGLALALVLAATPSALADTYNFYGFSYTDATDGISLTGNLTVDVTAGDLITNITNATYNDTVTGTSGTATLDTNSSDLSVSAANNVFYPAGPPYLDEYGMLLQVGHAYVNIWYCPFAPCGYMSEPVGYVDDEYNNSTDLGIGYPIGIGYPNGVDNVALGGTISATYAGSAATLEPDSWLLLGTGFLGLMGIAYRRGKTPFTASKQ
jgi:hypothetical protein